MLGSNNLTLLCTNTGRKAVLHHNATFSVEREFGIFLRHDLSVKKPTASPDLQYIVIATLIFPVPQLLIPIPAQQRVLSESKSGSCETFQNKCKCNKSLAYLLDFGIFAIANVSNSLLMTNVRKKEFSSVITIFLENFALLYWSCCDICPGYGAIISK